MDGNGKGVMTITKKMDVQILEVSARHPEG